MKRPVEVAKEPGIRQVAALAVRDTTRVASGRVERLLQSFDDVRCRMDVLAGALLQVAGRRVKSPTQDEAFMKEVCIFDVDLAKPVI